MTTLRLAALIATYCSVIVPYVAEGQQTCADATPNSIKTPENSELFAKYVDPQSGVVSYLLFFETPPDKYGLRGVPRPGATDNVPHTAASLLRVRWGI